MVPLHPFLPAGHPPSYPMALATVAGNRLAQAVCSTGPYYAYIYGECKGLNARPLRRTTLKPADGWSEVRLAGAAALGTLARITAVAASIVPPPPLCVQQAIRRAFGPLRSKLPSHKG